MADLMGSNADHERAQWSFRPLPAYATLCYGWCADIFVDEVGLMADLDLK